MIRYLLLSAVAAAAMSIAAPSAQAATLAECAAQWRTLKEQGKQGDQTYREFSSKCMKGDSAEAAPAAEEPPAKKETADKPKKKKQEVAADAVDENDGNNGSGALKKECDAKWKTNKASTGASGWKAYFTFMAKCM